MWRRDAGLYTNASATESAHTNVATAPPHKIHAQMLITRRGKRMAATVPRPSERLVVIMACTVAAICLYNYPMHPPPRAQKITDVHDSTGTSLG